MTASNLQRKKMVLWEEERLPKTEREKQLLTYRVGRNKTNKGNPI